MFGLFVNLKDRLCLVVGGGAVGRRKARALREAGARVRVVCLERRHAAEAEVEWLTEPYEARHLDGVALVFAAATAEVNARVVADARARGVWACDAADPVRGDFVTPGVVRRGEVVVAMTTGVPALTRRLRERLEDFVAPEYAQWAALLAKLRPRVLEAVPEGKQAALWEALTGEQWLARLREGGEAAVSEEMLAVVRACSDA